MRHVDGERVARQAGSHRRRFRRERAELVALEELADFLLTTLPLFSGSDLGAAGKSEGIWQGGCGSADAARDGRA